MGRKISFQTPENVEISYDIAGVGTRYIAWLLDLLILGLLAFLLLATLFLLVMTEVISVNSLPMTDSSEDIIDENGTFSLYGTALIMLILGLGSFFYFGLSELFMRGQTLGKKVARIRVVKANGFQLDAGSIVIRSVFRLIDQIPVVWPVPFLHPSHQRLGDLVGGTVVISEGTPAEAQRTQLREYLQGYSQENIKYRIDQSILSRLSDELIETIEHFLARSNQIPQHEAKRLSSEIVALVNREVTLSEWPDQGDETRYLEELMGAYLKKQYKRIG